MRVVYSILLLLTVGAVAPVSAGTFEGLVDYELKGPDGKVHEMHYAIKEPRIRMNMQNPKGESAIMIMDPSKKTTYMLMPSRKMAMKHTLSEPTERKRSASSGKKPEFVNTGRKETIAGYDCTVYSFKDESSEGEVCNAQGMGFFRFGGAGKPGASGESTYFWEKEAREKGLFPLRMSHKDLKEGKTVTMVATHIEKKSLPASDFEVPSDYKIMEGFGGPMAGGPGHPGAGPAGGPPMGGDYMKKMMNATPEERQKMAEEMRKNYGGDAQ